MKIQKRISLMTVVTGFIIGFSGSASATHIESSEWVAKLVSAEGRVESMTHAETNWTPAKLEDTYFPGDRVRTLEKSRAAVLLKNESILRLDQRTTVKFSAVTPEKPSLLELIKGRVLFFSRFPRKLIIDTPFVNAASEGTEFLIEVDEEAG
ncbi:MAG: FecR domain-containing protein, partial [Nitrospiria bacterium]